jgi:hypothetical protein
MINVFINVREKRQNRFVGKFLYARFESADEATEFVQGVNEGKRSQQVWRVVHALSNLYPNGQLITHAVMEGSSE